MTYTPDSSGFVTTPLHIRQVADRMGSISQRAMLCHRGRHETRSVLRYIPEFIGFFAHGALGMPARWEFIGNKCKHCGRWV